MFYTTQNTHSYRKMLFSFQGPFYGR